MTTDGRIHTKRITDEAGRNATLLLLAATYEKEKGWITEPNSQFPASHLGLPNISWYMVWLDRNPVGVLRILYDPPLLQYAKYELKLLDSGLEIAGFLAQNRIVEVGRFAVLAASRQSSARYRIDAGGDAGNPGPRLYAYHHRRLRG